MTVKARGERAVWLSAEEAAKTPYVCDCTAEWCYYTVACKTIDEAWWQFISHLCPRRGDVMNAGPSIIIRAWEQLDEQVAEIYQMAPKVEELRASNTPDLTGILDRAIAAKARARGKAEIQALLMAPYYQTADEISAEAMRRYNAGQSSQPHRTLGIDPRLAAGDIDLAPRRRACARGEHEWFAASPTAATYTCVVDGCAATTPAVTR